MCETVRKLNRKQRGKERQSGKLDEIVRSRKEAERKDSGRKSRGQSVRNLRSRKKKHRSTVFQT